jgi:NAD(P)H-hydrate epimerase
MHKGDRGRVLVVGGDHGMAGAAIHAARAALGAGAGLVKLAAHEETVRAAQASLPDALTVTTMLGPAVEPGLAEAMAWADAVVIGPGLGRGAERSRFVSTLLARADCPVVLDADALQLGLAPETVGASPRVLTPHHGEFRAMFPGLSDTLGSDRFAAAGQAALLARATVLLKGVPTIVATPGGPSLVVAAGNPALATGGSGDLLAGFVGAFLARDVEPQAAAALGALVLGRSAELASAGLTVRATRPADVIAALPDLWRRLASPPVWEAPVLLRLDPPALI